jgi:hypothetical protein
MWTIFTPLLHQMSRDTWSMAYIDLLGEHYITLMHSWVWHVWQNIICNWASHHLLRAPICNNRVTNRSVLKIGYGRLFRVSNPVKLGID